MWRTDVQQQKVKTLAKYKDGLKPYIDPKSTFRVPACLLRPAWLLKAFCTLSGSPKSLNPWPSIPNRGLGF